MLKPLPLYITTSLFLLLCCATGTTKTSSQDDQNLLNAELFTACNNGNLRLAQSLLERRAQVNAAYMIQYNPYMPWHGGTPLDVATHHNHDQIMLLLLHNGANPCAINPVTGLPPITTAALQGHLNAITVLLRWGATPNCSDAVGGSPLLAAAENGKIRAVKELLSAKAQVDVAAMHPDSLGTTALIQAAENGHVNGWRDCKSIVEQLIEAKADVNKARTDGETALHRAADKGYPGAVRMLLAAGADTTKRDTYKRTPLHNAVINNHLNTAYLLLGARASKQAFDEEDKRPTDYATTGEMKRLLSCGKTALKDAPKKRWFIKAAKK